MSSDVIQKNFEHQHEMAAVIYAVVNAFTRELPSRTVEQYY